MPFMWRALMLVAWATWRVERMPRWARDAALALALMLLIAVASHTPL